jgi:hypothetical protein
MKYLAYITFVLILLKLTGLIQISWGWTLLPIILLVSLVIFVMAFITGMTIIAYKLINKPKTKNKLK